MTTLNVGAVLQLTSDERDFWERVYLAVLLSCLDTRQGRLPAGQSPNGRARAEADAAIIHLRERTVEKKEGPYR